MVDDQQASTGLGSNQSLHPDGRMMDEPKLQEKRAMLGLGEETTDDMVTQSQESKVDMQKVEAEQMRNQQFILNESLDTTEKLQRIEKQEETGTFEWRNELDTSYEQDKQETSDITNKLDATTRLGMISKLQGTEEEERTERLEVLVGIQMSNEVEIGLTDRTEELNWFEEAIWKQGLEKTNVATRTTVLDGSAEVESIMQGDSIPVMDRFTTFEKHTPEVENTSEVDRTSEIEEALEVDTSIEEERSSKVDRMIDVEESFEVNRTIGGEEMSEVNLITEMERMLETDSMEEIERIPEAERMTELERMSETEKMPELETTSETERMPEFERTSEAKRMSEMERTSTRDRVTEEATTESVETLENLGMRESLERITALDNIASVERRHGVESNQLPFPRGVFQRVRRDTLDSQASSIDFSDDALESDDSSDVGFNRQPVNSDPISAAVRRRLNNRAPLPRHGPGTSDDETDQEGRGPLPPVLQRSTTFERVLSDAIVHLVPIEELKVILDAGAKLMDPSARKPNPIHYTVWQRYPDAAELLLQQGYDVNALDDFGYSALHLAARHGYIDMMEILIKHGSVINFNVVDTEDRFPIDAVEEPLRMALKFGHHDAAKLLLENGANPNGRYFFGSEINLASPLQPELLELLLEFGARVNEQDRNGLTPIMKACRLRQGMGSLLLLLSYGGDVNIRADRRHDHRTALHYAVLSGSLAIVSVLLDSGAQVRFETEYNRPTPLHLAVRRGDIKMINLLLDVGADINSSTTLIGSVLHMACSEKVTNRLEVMELLLARGADPNIIVPGLDGTPMLPPLGDYLAASDEHDCSVINLLLRYGAEVIMKSPQTSPLGLLGCVSALRQQPLILEELLEGAQQFDLGLIRYTSLLGAEERRLCLEIAGSPLSLRHLSRVCIRHESATAKPESVLKMELPSIISKYLLYEIS